MALSSPDPITSTFELRQEMMQVAEVEKEFQVSISLRCIGNGPGNTAVASVEA